MINMRPRFDRPALIPVKICSFCGDQLNRGSVSDQCEWHPKRGRECACGALLQNKNTTGFCIVCLHAKMAMAADSGQRTKAAQIEPIKDQVKARPINISAQVLSYTAKIFNLNVDDITGRRQFQLLVEARCVVTIILRQRKFSYPQIGRVLGGRDHSTIINLHQKFERWSDANPAMHGAVHKIQEALTDVDASRQAARSAMAEGVGA